MFKFSKRLAPFTCHGVRFRKFNGNHAEGDCPFCGKIGRFYANAATSQWDCKVCGEKGNVITFLGKVAQAALELTTDEDYKSLSRMRGLPVKALREWKLGFNGTDWLLPVYSKNGTVHDIRRWNPKTKVMKSTTGCQIQLYGVDRACRVPQEGTVWLCEGEWDCQALSYVLAKAGIANARAVGVPGAGIFKDEWRDVFKNKKVILCYDNDEAGKAGTRKAYERLLNTASSIQTIAWPEGTPDKYDIRDFYQKHCRKMFSHAILTKLKTYLQPVDSCSDIASVTGGDRPVLTCLFDVKPEKLDWLWENRIPMGKLSIIAGDPGVGKSFLTLYMAARISRGMKWPDSNIENVSGSVILLTAEDGLADTIRPRLDAAGADTTKIHALEGIKVVGNDNTKEFNLTNDLGVLEKAIKENSDTRLVVIDPITAYMGKTDSHNNAEVRSVLAPLAKIAELYKVAVLAVSHLNKNESQNVMYRTMGSLAFVAAARAAWLVTKDKNDAEKRLLLPCKTNLSVNPTGMAYRIIENTVKFEDEPFEVNSADDFCNEEKASNKAITFLKETLKDGPVNSIKVISLAEETGISESTLKRAKQTLEINAFKEGIKKFGAWFWELPSTKK